MSSTSFTRPAVVYIIMSDMLFRKGPCPHLMKCTCARPVVKGRTTSSSQVLHQDHCSLHVRDMLCRDKSDPHLEFCTRTAVGKASQILPEDHYMCVMCCVAESFRVLLYV